MPAHTRSVRRDTDCSGQQVRAMCVEKRCCSTWCPVNAATTCPSCAFSGRSCGKYGHCPVDGCACTATNCDNTCAQRLHLGSTHTSCPRQPLHACFLSDSLRGPVGARAVHVDVWPAVCGVLAVWPAGSCACARAVSCVCGGGSACPAPSRYPACC